MRHPISKHCVVAKVLLLKDLQEPWMMRQVEQEVAILSRLKHANVIQYIATFQAARHGHTCRHGRATSAACRLGRLGSGVLVYRAWTGRRTLERSSAAAQAARWHVAPAHVAPAVRLCQTPTMLRLLASGRLTRPLLARGVPPVTAPLTAPLSPHRSPHNPLHSPSPHAPLHPFLHPALHGFTITALRPFTAPSLRPSGAGAGHLRPHGVRPWR